MTERLCALPGCDEPIVRRPGEKMYFFRDRKCCCRDHGAKLAGLAIAARKKGEPVREDRGMSPARAAAVLALPEPRLRWQFEELPLAEQRKVLENRGVRFA